MALLRPYDVHDLVSLAHLETLVDMACWRSSIVHSVHVNEPKNTHQIIVAERNGILVGCVLATTLGSSFFQAPMKISGQVYMAWLAVHPNYQRQGIATQLIRELRQIYTSTQEPHRCWLHVRPDNAAALALYEKEGFEHYEDVFDYYGSHEHAYMLTANWKSSSGATHLVTET